MIDSKAPRDHRESDGTPQNSPVGFTYNEELGPINIAGYRMSKSQKFRNIARNEKGALVVDDITSSDSSRPQRRIGQQSDPAAGLTGRIRR